MIVQLIFENYTLF